jgi:conjugative relaxase-like TrwC/TraI family protein
MLTLSKALAAGQAKEYFQAEYANTQESYYTETDTVKGKWFGRQAEAWELQGEVNPEHFERLCEGQHPLSGAQLVRHVTPHKYENAYGETVETSEHRAGWDATFSAPKSVSLAALVGGDERIVEAHDRSVDVALNELEKYVQARIGGNHPAQTTAKMIAAKFQHDSARPDRNSGYAAPQLHTHTVIFNVTETDDGRIKPIQPLELYRTQRYATEIYRAVLAAELQKLGYEIAVDARTGAPEISGFSKDYLVASSPRREEVQREAAEMKARLAQEGLIVEDGAGLRQTAAKSDRLSKKYDRGEMRSRHLEMDARFGKQAFRLVEEAQVRGAVIVPEEQIKSRARESITFARENAGEREAVVDKRKVLVDALRRNLSLTTYKTVVGEFANNIDNGNFIRITRNPGIDEVTTSQTVAMEQSNIRTVIAGKGTQTAILTDEQLDSVLTRISERQRITLNDRQRGAVETILGSTDRIVGLEGLAGTGKTTTLSVLREAVERCGYAVQGFAPTGTAADLLAESGIRSSTLQKFVATAQINCATEDKFLYILDESSLSDTRNMFLFFQKAGPSARILLVGDSGQHQAVEAGAPFEQFVKAGMQTASLDQIVRQRSDLRKPVEQLARRDVIGAVKTLLEQGRISEVVDDEERLREIARDYVSNPKRTLVISPANQERVAINSIIHQELQSQGVVGAVEHETRVLVLRQDMTGTERKFAISYVPHEDIIRYNKGSKVFGINKGEYARVLNATHAENELTVQLQDGRNITYNPKRLSGVSVYKEATREFSVGDRIQFRAPFPEAKVKNTELGTITNIAQGQFMISLCADRVVTFDPQRFPHLDHGYAVTSYSSQGKTMDRVLVNAETTETDLLVNQRMAYVAVSRARLDARIYTDSAADLSGALARRKDKTMALEALKQMRNGASDDNEPRSDFNVQAMQHEYRLETNGGVAKRNEACSIARLKGRFFLAESNVVVAQQRLNNFEGTRHLYSFEIDGNQWSLVRVDRQERIKERQIDYSKRVISAYRMRLYGAINNPLKLYGLRGYKENAATAKEQIKETQQQIDNLRQIRETITSCLDKRRAGLQTELRTEIESAQKLSHTLDLNLDPKSERETILPEFTEKELDQLEANARILRDPKLLRTVYQHFEQHYGMTTQGIQTIAVRASETLEFGKACLSDVNDRIQTFDENREFVPVLLNGTGADEQTATVSELNKQAAPRNTLARIFTDSPSPLERVKEALNQRNSELIQERTTINSFVDAASDITNQYRETLMAAVRTDIAALNQPTESHDVKDITARPRQTNTDEHLNQMRQTIDKLSLQNGAINETGIEAGLAEAESAATESLAALI